MYTLVMTIRGRNVEKYSAEGSRGMHVRSLAVTTRPNRGSLSGWRREVWAEVTTVRHTGSPVVQKTGESCM